MEKWELFLERLAFKVKCGKDLVSVLRRANQISTEVGFLRGRIHNDRQGSVFTLVGALAGEPGERG